MVRVRMVAYTGIAARCGSSRGRWRSSYRSSITALGLGILALDVAAKTALLIFGAMLVVGVGASAAFLLRHTDR